MAYACTSSEVSCYKIRGNSNQESVHQEEATIFSCAILYDKISFNYSKFDSDAFNQDEVYKISE